ncbi:hypothetical protein M3Y99_00901200 [Aphelenchoides fujianensis]|nr:hypothetical protein M3Y99_00901200 [Aphelenchoides fujianensis]
MAIYFPQKFRTAHPEWYATFKENKNRLVSNFDLHETFREILRIEDADRKPVGRSLFTRIPERRSCEDARIAEHHCLCMRKESLNLDEGVKANMTALIDGYASGILGELECVREFELKPPPKFVGRTINAQARTGARFPSMWVDRLNEKPEVFQARWNEIFDVEFESRLDIRTANGALRRFQLRSRVFFQRKTGETWRNAESFVFPADRSTFACKPLILENLCSCFP